MQQTLFEPDIAIPHSDMKLFIACNSADNGWIHKKSFYNLKSSMLEKYGVRNGYDLQIIEKKCWNCNGTGEFIGYYGHTGETCRSCNNGVYHTNRIALERWVLNGKQFHCPIGWVYSNGDVQLFNGLKSSCTYRFTDTINGIVTHCPTDIPTDFAFICLLYKYDKPGYKNRMTEFINALTSDEWRKWSELDVETGRDFFSTLALWFNVGQDDLPF